MNQAKLNIIIAEDNEQFLEGLKLLLKKCTHYEIIDICRNGKELVESAVLHKANLIISDIEMPVMNGLEAAKLVNYRYPDIPMIAVTMYIENVFLKDVIMAGFKGFVYKPEVAIHLNEVIFQVLQDNFMFPSNLKIQKPK